MPISLNINDILFPVKRLDKEEPLNLLQRLVLLLRKTEIAKTYSFRLTSLSRLGSEIWRNANIDKYIDEGRQW
jgi:Neuraminidase (sialidase)